MSITYKDSGVDVEKTNSTVETIKRIANITHRSDVSLISSIGGFSAAFEIPPSYTNPVIVAGIDGVGTKLRLALRLNTHAMIGYDLVGMCVNDILMCGAKPLAFLDYYASNNIVPRHLEKIIKSIAEACKNAGCVLVGGETAEIPNTYAGSNYELVGFAIGVVEKTGIITGEKIKSGDTLISIPSTGLHSNGYSLINTLISNGALDLEQKVPHWFQTTMGAGPVTLGEALMWPTRIYTSLIKTLLASANIHGMAHITGGGLIDNIPRMLPDELTVDIQWDKIEFPTIFRTIQNAAEISREEMFKTFNCGIGAVVCVNKSDVDTVLGIIRAFDMLPNVIGHVTT